MDIRPVFSKASIPDVVGLMCAVLMLIAFFLVPWYNIFGINYVGPGEFAQFEGVGMYLIPIAAIGAGAIALQNLLARRSKRARNGGYFLAGLVGLAYYGMFLVRNHDNAFDRTQFMGVGFWLALAAAVGLIVQSVLFLGAAKTEAREE